MVNFPASLDALSNPTATTNRDDAGFEHHTQHANANDILEALEAKVGTGASTPTANTVLRGTGTGASAFGLLQALDITAGAVMTKIAETILGSPAASISFSSIPASYKHLLILGLARDVGGAPSTTVDMLMNSFSTFDNQNLQGNASTAAAIEGLAAGRALVGYCAGGAAAAGLFAGLAIFIPHYAGTVHDKMAIGLSVVKVGTSAANLVVSMRAAYARSATAAITSITLSSTSGSNLATGSMFSLYGLPG